MTPWIGRVLSSGSTPRPGTTANAAVGCCGTCPRLWPRELTPRQREVLALYMERDMNVTQIAAVLGVNKSTVSRSLHRAIRRLERCLRYSF